MSFCRTGARRRPVCTPPAAQPQSRPSTAPFQAKTWTQLVRDSSFHDDKPSHRNSPVSSCPKAAWEECPESREDDEYRIILLGKSGSGKSSTGNCILNKDIFGKNSTKCRYGSANRFGKKICVVDTYEVFDHHTDENIMPRELVKLVGMTSPGFHVLVLVLAIENIDNKEHRLFREFINHFGNEVKSRTIVLFTKRDILDSDGSTIYGYVSEVPKGMQEVMEQCKRRYIAFNNHATGRERDVQVRRLLGIIENISKQNKGKHFSSEVFGATELILSRRVDDIKRNLKRELRHKQEELEANARMCETPCSARSSYNFSEPSSPRGQSSKLKKSSSRKKNTASNFKSRYERDEYSDKITKLPSLNDQSRKKDKQFTKRRSSSKQGISVIEEDDDFGDCDIEALKRRIEEEIEVPTLHLPEENALNGDVSNINNNKLNNDDISIDGKIAELKKKYEEMTSWKNLREGIRKECEDETPELFQMMWKLAKYFDESINKDMNS